jgi:hypothetical protein
MAFERNRFGRPLNETYASFENPERYAEPF